MLILSTTTDKIQVILGGAIATNQLDCVATYKDISTSAYSGSAPSLVATNNTTAVDLVDSPASSTQRIVDFISVFNTDTANATVTIRLNRNGTLGTLFKCVLGIGELMTYTEGQGWVVYQNNGSIKNGLVNGNNPLSSDVSQVVLANDVINNNATANTMLDVTGLSFPVTAGVVTWFRFFIPYTAAVGTTGSRWSINGPSFTRLSYTSRYPISATSLTTNYSSAYDFPTTSNASSLAAGNVAIIDGHILPVSSGNVIARFASEISNSAITALAGSTVNYQDLLTI
jgi:hypothetical protein